MMLFAPYGSPIMRSRRATRAFKPELSSIAVGGK